MLIRALRAENFMRFSRLRVENLPAEGLIGIEGPNESGKTTIGEAILFALFGKTRLAVESPVLGLIRWGADAMSAEVEFSLRRAGGHPEDGGAAEGEYLIYRQVDRYGTNYVKVVSLPERAEVASGNLRVSEFLAKTVGFDAAEFQRSFYHDQYEIRRVEREQVAFFETATGIAHLLRAARAVRQEMEPLEREFSYYQKEIARNRSQIEKHAKNVAKLPDLTSRLRSLEAAIEEMRSIASQLEGKRAALLDERSALEARLARVERLETGEPEEVERALAEVEAEEGRAVPRLEALLGADGIRDRAAAVRERLGMLLRAAKEWSALLRRIAEERAHVLEEARREAERRDDLDGEVRAKGARTRRAWIPLGLLFSGAVAFAAALFRWLARPPDPGCLQSLVPSILGVSTPRWADAAALAAATLAALGAFSRQARRSYRRLLLRTALEARLEKSAEAAQRLAAEASRLESLLAFRKLADLPRLVAEAEASGNARVAAAAAEARRALGSLADEGAVAAAAGELLGAYRALRAALSSGISRREKEKGESETAGKRLEGDRSRIENEIRECQAESAKKQALEEKNRELESAAAQVRAEIDRRSLAASLLEEAAAAMRSEIGPTLTRLFKALLPRLTLGRYRDARVESNLEIKVYSSEKDDFLSLHELSGGTSEALSLGLRLAVSQALVWTRARQAQFAFLDEPFQMMDPERCAETLEVLRRLSPSLPQFFVIQPEFSERARSSFRSIVRTSREGSSLEADCR